MQKGKLVFREFLNADTAHITRGGTYVQHFCDSMGAHATVTNFITTRKTIKK